MRVVGITGGIASGKSSVARFLMDRGYHVIDADQVARWVVEPGQPGLLEIAETFGASMINVDGTLRRSALRALIAKDPQAQQRLNQIMHPLIRQEIERQVADFEAQGEQLVFVEAALMIEAGTSHKYDHVILVTAPLDERLRRLADRDSMPRDQAEMLISRQWTDEQKIPFADSIIENGSNLDELHMAIDYVLNTITSTPK
ncbi:MAG: dephospho-CoA kinase [Acidobacteria bacterium]|nr:dephospho-CoA kinase [Acidobacteriota bacterium]